MNLKKLLLLVLTIVIVIATLFLINKKVDIWFFALLVSPITLFYNDKMGELYNEIMVLLGEDNWKTEQRRLEKKGVINKDTRIRISFAYLFRIEIDGKYFLVPNTRTKKYQPVGGVYKFNNMEYNYLKENFSFKHDEPIAVDEVTKSDYRLFIKSGELGAFIKRFDKTINRENIKDLSREFNEELFESGILKKQGFGSLNYKYCGRHMTSIIENGFHPFELLLADIVEVRLTENQKSIFKSLMKEDSNEYKFATARDIKTKGMKFGSQDLSDNIASHTYKILIENSDKLKRRDEYKNLITVAL